MRTEIPLRLEEGEEKSFPFRSCGTTAIIYRSVFGVDLMKDFSSLISSMGDSSLGLLMGGKDVDIEHDPEALRAMLAILESGKTDVIYRMAFIMNKQAEGFKMQEITLPQYYEWLEQFEALELLRNAGSIITLYAGNRATTSEVKKKQGVRQSGK